MKIPAVVQRCRPTRASHRPGPGKAAPRAAAVTSPNGRKLRPANRRVHASALPRRWVPASSGVMSCPCPCPCSCPCPCPGDATTDAANDDDDGGGRAADRTPDAAAAAAETDDGKKKNNDPP